MTLDLNTILWIAGQVSTLVGAYFALNKLWQKKLRPALLQSLLDSIEPSHLKPGTLVAKAVADGKKGAEAFAQTTKLDSFMERMDKVTTEMKLVQVKHTLLHLIKGFPEEKRSIQDNYDYYKSLGGNSWVDDIYNQWKNPA